MTGEARHEQACLSVVMPCYNEEATVGHVVRQVLSSPYTREVIAVDDGSTDRTLEALRTITDPRLVVVPQRVNRGKGAALRVGFARAKGRFVIVQDADLEYDPAEYGAVLGPLLEDKADVVYGSRFHTAKPHRVLYFWHSVGNWFLTTVSNMSTNLNLTDMETCYKAFRREVLDGIELREDRFGFEAEITAKVAAGDWRIYEVGVAYSGRTYAQGKKVGWKDGMRAIYCIVRYSPLLSLGERWRRMPPSARTARQRESRSYGARGVLAVDVHPHRVDGAASSSTYESSLLDGAADKDHGSTGPQSAGGASSSSPRQPER